MQGSPLDAALTKKESKHVSIMNQYHRLSDAIDRLESLLDELTKGSSLPKEKEEAMLHQSLAAFLGNHAGDLSQLNDRVNTYVDNLREALL